MEVQACYLDDVYYRFFQSGSGQDLIFVGGAFQAIDKLGPLAEHWQKHYRLTAIELPGFGESDLVSRNIGMEFSANCIAQVIEHCDIQNAIIVGTSYGAPSVFRFACKYEDRLAAMILGGACPSVSDEMEYKVRFLLWLLACDDKAWMFPKAFTEVMCNIHAPGIPNASRIQQIVMRSLLRLNDAGRAKFIENSYRLLREKMPTPNSPLEVPSLVFTGEHDLFTPAKRLGEFNKLCSNLTVAEIENADHMYHLEQTQDTLRLIDNFVASLNKQRAVAA